jgi:ABC-type ATPase involved in cell division
MTSDATERPIIRLSHVHHRYGRHAALTDLSLEISKNEMVFVNGRAARARARC